MSPNKKAPQFAGLFSIKRLIILLVVLLLLLQFLQQ
jgi:hypothetical protein